MRTSESIKEIASALITFHAEVNSIHKTANNPFFKSKYVPLDKILTAIGEPLKTANLSFVQFPEEQGGLTTRLMHTSGEWMEATYFMKPTKEDPQGYGSVITYQRRYALSAILGLNTDEDDDGNKASVTPKKIDADTFNYIDGLIRTSTYDDEQKERLFNKLHTMTEDKVDTAIANLMMNQMSESEMPNINQKGINKMLDNKLKNEKA